MAMTNDQKTIKRIAGKIKRILEGDATKIENNETRAWFQRIFQDVHNFVSSASLGVQEHEEKVESATELKNNTGEKDEQ